MIYRSMAFPLVAGLILSSHLLRATEPKASGKVADALFKAGKFTEAEVQYARIVAENGPDAASFLGLGEIALFSNRFRDAQDRLDKALRLDPNSIGAKTLLAEVYYRQDDFSRAAPLLRATGREAQAKTLESFGTSKPYEIDGGEKGTSLPFVVTDPLPLVRVRINDRPEVNFLIDTGAAELVLDPDFAKEVGVKTFGAVTGTFAGGKQAQVQYGRVDSIALGDFTVKNVPVATLNTRQLSRPIFGGKKVDGIIGTVLFYHFLATLDYPKGTLVLEKKTPENLAFLEADAKAHKSVIVPFWMAGDHYMVAWGTVEKSAPVLLFVDTGLAGGGVTLAKSMIEEAHIKLRDDQAADGVGGGGKVRVVPFEVKELSLGEAAGQNVRGLFSDVFPIEDAFGFRMGGIISHGFFRPYALTFDFTKMRLVLKK